MFLYGEPFSEPLPASVEVREVHGCYWTAELADGLSGRTADEIGQGRCTPTNADWPEASQTDWTRHPIVTVPAGLFVEVVNNESRHLLRDLVDMQLDLARMLAEAALEWVEMSVQGSKLVFFVGVPVTSCTTSRKYTHHVM